MKINWVNTETGRIYLVYFMEKKNRFGLSMSWLWANDMLKKPIPNEENRFKPWNNIMVKYYKPKLKDYWFLFKEILKKVKI